MTLSLQENSTRPIVGFYDGHDTVCLDCVDIFRLDIDSFIELYFKERLEYTCIYCGAQFPTEEEINHY
jgi:hypothetical protein